jgi:hypothetical protein
MANDDLICWLPVPARDHQARVWLYVRFTLSFRDVEDLLAERGLDVSYETVSDWNGRPLVPGATHSIQAGRTISAIVTLVLHLSCCSSDHLSQAWIGCRMAPEG